jgi:hypothetical protein
LPGAEPPVNKVLFVNAVSQTDYLLKCFFESTTALILSSM